MVQIRHNYIAVGTDRVHSFGGSQMRSASKTIREVGCGAVAALDLLLYLSRWHSACFCDFFREAAQDGVIEEREYDELLKKLSRRYFPLIPKLGINGMMLSAGLNAFFIRYALPCRASWGIGTRHLWTEIDKMLSLDIPVILAVGPNFPLFWQKNELTFYAAGRSGELRAACKIRAHYVTVTGIDDEFLQVSSWGREYFIRRSEYMSYIRNRSGSLVSNIVRIRLL